MIYLANRRDNQRTKALTKIQVFSNLAAVTLSVNGKEYQAKNGVNAKHWVVENAELKKGENTIRAYGKNGTQQLEDEMKWNLQ